MLAFSTIVCPVDFSDHSKAALERAAAWARHFRARLIVVTVGEPLLVNAAAATYDMDLVREDLLPELRAFVEDTSVARAAGLPPPEVMVLVGESASEIVALAQREHAQLIVIATDGCLTDVRAAATLAQTFDVSLLLVHKCRVGKSLAKSALEGRSPAADRSPHERRARLAVRSAGSRRP